MQKPCPEHRGSAQSAVNDYVDDDHVGVDDDDNGAPSMIINFVTILIIITALHYYKTVHLSLHKAS